MCQACWKLLAAALSGCLFVLLAYRMLQRQPGASVSGDGWVAFTFVCMEQEMGDGSLTGTGSEDT